MQTSRRGISKLDPGFGGQQPDFGVKMQPAEGISPVVSLGPDSPVTSGSSSKMPDQKHFIERKNGRSGAVVPRSTKGYKTRFSVHPPTDDGDQPSGQWFVLGPVAAFYFQVRGPWGSRL